jgi:hypothetical protein
MFSEENPMPEGMGKACPKIAMVSPDCKNVEFPNGLN